MIDKLIEYLKKRPIAPILVGSKEKNDLKALKLMCVVDYYAEKHGHFKEIRKFPKLMHQLLNFRSYSNFQYYDCHVNSGIGARLLQCKSCELVGPYALIMTHMAVNHNQHVSLTRCAFCSREYLSAHIQNDSLDGCYLEYMHKRGVTVISDDQRNIHIEFNKLLKDLSRALNVLITRTESFAGTGYRSIEPVQRKIPDFPRTCTVSKTKTSNKRVDDSKLDDYFRLVISYIFGGNGISRLTGTHEEENEEIVILSSEDENDENITNNRETVRVSEKLWIIIVFEWKKWNYCYKVDRVGLMQIGHSS